MSRKATIPKPPKTLKPAAKARWIAVVSALADRGPIDLETLETYCQVWARWREAEEAIAQTGQLVRRGKGARAHAVAHPLIAVASQAGNQVRALERQLGIGASSPAKAPASKAGKADGPLITRRELAIRLGTHPITISKWQEDGMPIASRGDRGRPSLYSELAVRAWKQQRDELANSPENLSATHARARRDLAQASLAEQALKIRQRDLLDRESVERVWSRHVEAVRTKLLAVPSALSDIIFRAATTDGVDAVEQALAEAMNDTLRELADDPSPPTNATA